LNYLVCANYLLLLEKEETQRKRERKKGGGKKKEKTKMHTYLHCDLDHKYCEVCIM
jgi:hypothetical protein